MNGRRKVTLFEAKSHSQRMPAIHKHAYINEQPNDVPVVYIGAVIPSEEDQSPQKLLISQATYNTKIPLYVTIDKSELIKQLGAHVRENSIQYNVGADIHLVVCADIDQLLPDPKQEAEKEKGEKAGKGKIKVKPEELINGFSRKKLQQYIADAVDQYGQENKANTVSANKQGK